MPDFKKLFLVLLADDDADDSMLFANAVNDVEIPIQLSHADDGQQLLKFLKDHQQPDIIFLDLNMPFKNGFECLKDIRKNEQYNKVPIIIYSTSGDKNDIERSYREGANFYVIKPNSYSGIVAMLDKVCNMYLKDTPPPASREVFVMKFPLLK